MCLFIEHVALTFYSVHQTNRIVSLGLNNWRCIIKFVLLCWGMDNGLNPKQKLTQIPVTRTLLLLLHIAHCNLLLLFNSRLFGHGEP